MIQYLVVALIILSAIFYLGRKLYFTLKLKNHHSECTKCNNINISQKVTPKKIQ